MSRSTTSNPTTKATSSTAFTSQGMVTMPTFHFSRTRPTGATPQTLRTHRSAMPLSSTPVPIPTPPLPSTMPSRLCRSRPSRYTSLTSTRAKSSATTPSSRPLPTASSLALASTDIDSPWKDCSKCSHVDRWKRNSGTRNSTMRSTNMSVPTLTLSPNCSTRYSGLLTCD